MLDIDSLSTLGLYLDPGFGEGKWNENVKGRWPNGLEWLDANSISFSLAKSGIQTQPRSCFDYGHIGLNYNGQNKSVLLETAVFMIR